MLGSKGKIRRDESYMYNIDNDVSTTKADDNLWAEFNSHFRLIQQILKEESHPAYGYCYNLGVVGSQAPLIKSEVCRWRRLRSITYKEYSN